jgi:hypothetical protein
MLGKKNGGAEASMTLVMIGALLVIAGVVFMAAQPIWRGRLSGLRRMPWAPSSATLEPERPARGFSFRSNWPGLALIALGGVLLLAGAAFPTLE